MKLTKYMKKEFINSVMASLPHIDYVSQAQELLNEDALAKLPEVLRDKSLKHYLDTKRVYFIDFSCMGSFKVRNSEYKPSDEIKEKIGAIHALHETQRDSKYQATNQLYAIINSATTLKHAKEVVPENLHKFLPEENQPVINKFAVTTNELINNLKILGLQV